MKKNESQTIKRQKDPFHDCKWVSCGTAAGACMGTGSFIYATNFGKYGMLGPGCIAPGTLLVWVTVKGIFEGIYRYKHGTCIKVMDSCLLTDEKGEEGRKLRWKNCIPLLANVGCTVGRICVMTVGWDLAKKSGINQGIISTLVGTNNMLSVLPFYLCFNEKPSGC